MSDLTDALSQPELDAHFIELMNLSKMTREFWVKYLTLPRRLQDLTLQNFRDQDWATPGSTTFERVCTVILAIGSVAGVVGGIASAGSAVAALRGI
jgi:hypothetical protein